MKGFINACGERDSLGNNRLDRIRGLEIFAGEPVVAHTLKKFSEIGIDEPVLLYTNESHAVEYKKFFDKNNYNVSVKTIHKNSNPFEAYFYGLKSFVGNDVLIVADDNLFDFSLDGLVEKFREVDDNVLVSKKIKNISTLKNDDLNFGMCQYNSSGKITSASYSFDSTTVINSQNVILDIYLIHKKRIPPIINLSDKRENHKVSKNWWKNFHVWETDGFWADIGKPELRRLAELYFGNQLFFKK